MTASKKVFIAALLCMAILSNSNKGAYAVTLACKVSIQLCVAFTAFTERNCRTARNCVNAAYVKYCKEDTLDPPYGERYLNSKGCSGSGIPLISAMCLFIAGLFHML
eukprot:XP_011422824.1 PREDICTED: uncharacterized protein LOC105325126 [Crassostrea gigas]